MELVISYYDYGLLRGHHQSETREVRIPVKVRRMFDISFCHFKIKKVHKNTMSVILSSSVGLVCNSPLMPGINTVFEVGQEKRTFSTDTLDGGVVMEIWIEE